MLKITNNSLFVSVSNLVSSLEEQASNVSFDKTKVLKMFPSKTFLAKEPSTVFDMICKEFNRDDIEIGDADIKSFIEGQIVQLESTQRQLLLTPKRRGQVNSYYTLKFSLVNLVEDNDGKLSLRLESGRLISLQESNMTLKLSDGVCFSDIFVIRLKHKKDDAESASLAEKVIKDGVEINGQIYKPFIQTPSQSRSGHLYICPASKRKEYRRALANGVDYSSTIGDIGKRENRVSLGLSSGYSLGRRDKDNNVIEYYDYSVKYVDDVEKELNLNLVVPDEDNTHGVYRVNGIHILRKNNDVIKKFKGTELLAEYKEGQDGYDELNNFFKVETTDGYGLVDIRTAAHWAYELGCINASELEYFQANFTVLDKAEIESNPLLNSIFSRIPTAYQVRHQFDKGLLVIWDLQAEGILEDTMMPQSMHKEPEEAVSDCVWRICGYNKRKGNLNYLSYQAIQKLGMNAKLLCELGDETISYIRACLNSADKAIEFLNIHDTDVVCDEGIGSKLVEILSTNPNAICSEFVQNSLKTLIERQMNLTVTGKVIIEGSYNYLITDPRAYFGRDTLQSNENYYNGYVGELGLVRYPCVAHLEPQRLDFVDCNDLWFLKDLVVFNPFDGRWLGMGGADFDGDIALVIKDQRVVKLMSKIDLILNIVTHKMVDKVAETEEAIANMYLASYNGSDVGEYTNNVSLYISMVEHSKIGLSKLLINVCKWTMYIGKEIDRAKTRELFEFDEDTKELLSSIKKFNADWYKGLQFIKNGIYNVDFDGCYLDREIDGKLAKGLTRTNCIMGTFFRYMREKYGFLTTNAKWRNLITGKAEDEKQFLNILSSNCKCKGINDIKKHMEELYDDYTMHMMETTKLVNKMKAGYDLSNSSEEEEFNAARNNEYQKVKDLYRARFMVTCNNNGFDLYTASYVCAYIPYSKDKKEYKRSKSFAFNVCYEYILRLLAKASTGDILVKIPETIENNVTVTNNTILVDGIVYGTRLEDGEYEVINNRRGSFVKVSTDEVNARLSENIKGKNQVAYSKKAMLNELRIKNNEGSIDRYKQVSLDDIDITDKWVMTLRATKQYNTTPKEVLESLVNNEFTVAKSGEYFNLVMIDKVNDCVKPLAGLNGVASELEGMRFTLDKGMLEGINFYNSKGNSSSRKYDNGRIVKESVTFTCVLAGTTTDDEMKAIELVNKEAAKLDSSLDIDESLNYSDNDVDYSDVDYSDYSDIDYSDYSDYSDLECDSLSYNDEMEDNYYEFDSSEWE